jgi:hypothetical protein
MVNEAEETPVNDQAEPPMVEPEPEAPVAPEPEPESESEPDRLSLAAEQAWADLNVALGQHIAQVASAHATSADRSRIMAAAINATKLADQLRVLASRLI